MNRSEQTCAFCDNLNIEGRAIFRDDVVIAFPTNTPIVPGHILICPIRHVEKIDDLHESEMVQIVALLVRLKKVLQKTFDAEGFNVAWNEGGVAGQTVPHLHVHLVPRKKGDEGITEYEPRKFLYRPGSRAESPVEEIRDVARRLAVEFQNEIT